MKKFPILLRILLVPLLALFMLSGCKKDLSINECFDSKNGSLITVSGIVYFSDNEGYFISDGSSNIFVANMKEDTNTYNVGDKITVKGYYSFFESFSKITNVKEIKVNNTGNSTISPTLSGIIDILNHEKTDKIYSNYYEVAGKLNKSTNVSNKTNYYLTDLNDNKLYVYGNFKEENIGSVIRCNYVVKGYDNEVGFILEATKEETVSSYTITDLKTLIDNEVKEITPKCIYDSFPELKSSISDDITYKCYNTENVEYTSFSQSSINEDRTLILKATYNNETLTYESTCSFRKDSRVDVSELNSYTPSANWSNVKSQGIVVAKLHNESGNVYTLIVRDYEVKNSTIALVFHTAKDADGKTISGNISYTNSKFLQIELGSYIKFTARYNTTGDYKGTLDGVTYLGFDTTKDKKNFAIDYSSAIVIKDKDDYSKVALNYQDYIGKLLKFENPCLEYSSSKGTVAKNVYPLYTIDERALYDTVLITEYKEVASGTAFNLKTDYYIKSGDKYILQVGLTEFSDGVKYYTYSEKRKVFGFNISVNTENYGDESWYKSLDLPYANYNYKMTDKDYYCYIIPSTGSVVQLVFASPEYIKGYDETTEQLSEMVISEVERDCYFSTEDYTKLPEYLNYSVYGTKYPLTYSSNDTVGEIVKTTVGTETFYKAIFNNNTNTPKNATVEVSYQFNGKTISNNVIINISNIKLQNIENIKNDNDGSIVHSKGMIVAYASETSKTSDSKRELKGFVVKSLESNETVIVDGLEFYFEDNQSYPEGTSSSYFVYGREYDDDGNITNSGHDLKVGSVIEFTGKYIKNENRITLRNEGASLKWIEDGTVTLSNNITTVHNQTELSNAIYSIDEDGNTVFNYGKIIKLVGTVESTVVTNKKTGLSETRYTKLEPILFVATSSNERSAGQINYRIHYNYNATNSTQTMLNGFSIAIKQNNQKPNTGLDKWYEELGLPTIGVTNEMYPGCMAYTGEMYICLTYNSPSGDGINSFYNSCSIIEWNSWNLTKFDDLKNCVEKILNE